ncbi:putative sh3 domain signaling protein [Eutypa lata UCREL1]|uniref:Putative sh3 domain signaling protein n=1 Tax=Eutypa lata (strain UCR-EL1) TaxID=1287681 RepID=M7T5Y4_EUTLA|nr:putative sh3 domain signaling protein [Eutypa lata UCREL1]
MQSMQRQFGKLRHKSPGDNAKIAMLLNDYEDADRVLAKILEQAKTWRDSWVSLAHTQLGLVTEYEGLWDPIVGATDGHGTQAVPTPELQLHRTFKLKEAYTELKTDLLEEMALIDSRILTPTTDARACITPMRKTIKKRENKRLDYEQAQDRASKLQRKIGRSPKDDKALAKAEDDMARAQEEFNVADAHLRETLPPLVTATFTIIPPLLSSMVLIQNRLLGLYYTALHSYCQEFNFPSPPPPMEDVIDAFMVDFEPAKSEVEAIPCIASGKTVRQAMRLPDDSSSTNPNLSRPPSLVERRSSSNLIGSATMPPRPNRIPSAPILATGAASASPAPPRASFNSNVNSSSSRDHLTPTDFTTASRLGQGVAGLRPTSPGQPGTSTRPISPGALRPPTNPQADYFTRRASTSTTASTHSLSTTNSTIGTGIATPLSNVTNSSLSNGGVNAAAAKKKPPPPPPPKRGLTARQPDEFVIALYPFHGQGKGDLTFREGDRIRIVKKTATDQDWWVGELGGAQGSFPANYCRSA